MFFASLILILSISWSNSCIAGSYGGSGSGGKGNSSQIISKLKTNKLEPSSSVQINSSSLDISAHQILNQEGIYIWLDQNKTWQVRWKGEPGQLVWLRLQTENPISNIISIGAKVKFEKRGTEMLTITGVTSSAPAGVTFKCETPEINIDAKWNMMRDSNKIYISSFNRHPNKLPVVINPPIYKSIIPSNLTNKSDLKNANNGNLQKFKIVPVRGDKVKAGK